MNNKQIVQVFKALLQGTASRTELANRVGVQPKTIGSLLAQLKEEKLIHIIDYTNSGDGRNRVKVYSLGDGEDAKPKETQSQEDRSRRSYARKLAAANIFTPKTTFAGGKSLWQ